MDKDSFKYAGAIAAVTVDPAPPRESFADRASGRFLLLLAVVGAFAMVGGFDYADKVASEAKAKAERAARIQLYADMHTQRLSHPCMATISQGMTSVSMSEPRCVRVTEGKR